MHVCTRMRGTMMLLLAGMLVSGSRLDGQVRSDLWEGLDPGPYAVGYRVLYELDHSRVWNVAADSLAAEDFSRPLRVSMWYPGDVAADAATMRYGEFVYDDAPHPYFAQLNDLLVPRFLEVLRRGMPQTLTEDSLFALPLPYVKDATPASGVFPLVMYSPGGGGALPSNGMLAAYLASHGYVVGALPQLPSVDSRLERSYQSEVEAHARDVEFAIGVLQSLPTVDRHRLAVAGFSFGGMGAFRVAARNPNVDAVVGLDPSYRSAASFDRVTGSAAIDAYAFRIPVLTILRGDETPGGVVLDSLRYADRYIGRVSPFVHADFAEIRSILYPAALGENGLDAALVDAHRGYTAYAPYVLNFLNGVLKSEVRALEFVGRSSAENNQPWDMVEMTVRRGADVPTEDELVTLLAREGFERVVQRYREAKQRYPNLVFFRQSVLVNSGQDLRKRQEIGLASDVFRLVLQAYPRSARAYNGLAAVYVARGEMDQVVWAYERLLEVLPDDSTLSRGQKDAYQRETERMLRLLRLRL